MVTQGVAVVLFLSCLAAVNANPLLLTPPTNLRVQHQSAGTSPLRVIDPVLHSRPVFTWWLPTPVTSPGHLVQHSFRLELRTVGGFSVWDSGYVQSSQARVVYNGPPLLGPTRYVWRVSCQLTLADHEEVMLIQSPSSEWSEFAMGPASDSWSNSSTWIGGGAILRKEFTYTPGTSTTVYIASAGFFQLHVNGQHVSREIALGGAWTAWDQRVLYFALDLTSALKEGSNAIGVILGTGWRDTTSFSPLPNGPTSCDTEFERLLRLVVVAEPPTGSGTVLFGTDTSWEVSADGPLRYDSVYNGQTWDATKDVPGWDQPHFQPSPTQKWVPATAADCYKPIMSAHAMPVISVVMENRPISINQLPNGDYVVDFGLNLAGVVRLNSLNAAAGTNITIRHAETLLHPPYGPANGSIYQGNLESARATDVWLLAGTGSETLQPYFTYHGFQFVQISGWPGVLTADNITQIHFRTHNVRTSTFSSSSPILNAIQDRSVYAQGSNSMSVPTDCDQRNERLGWTGDAGLSAQTMAINYDNAAFIDNQLRNFRDSQGPAGDIPDVVPFYRYGGRPADLSWSAAYVELIWTRYSLGGDLEPATVNWASLLQYFNNIAYRNATGGGLAKLHAPYGDWIPANASAKPDNAYCGAFNYRLNAQQMAELARASGLNETAAEFETLAKQILAESQELWYTNKSGTPCWDNCQQTAQVLAVVGGAVPSGSEDAVTKSLLDLISDAEEHVTTGIIGAKGLFPALDQLKQHAAALTLAEQTTYPSWGYMIFNDIEPAYSNLWELWDSPGLGPVGNSRNHHMFSSISQWLLQSVGGIDVLSTASCAHTDSNRTVVLRPATHFGVSRCSTEVRHPSCGVTSLQYERTGGVQCAKVPEGRSTARPSLPAVEDVELSCGSGGSGGVISEVQFASWGQPTGSCGAFQESSSCRIQGQEIKKRVERLCLGRSSCLLPSAVTAWLDSMQDLSCSSTGTQRLYVQAQCSRPHGLHVAASVPAGLRAEVHIPFFDAPASSISMEVADGQQRHPLIQDGQVTGPKASTTTDAVLRVDLVSGDTEAVVVIGSGSTQLQLFS